MTTSSLEPLPASSEDHVVEVRLGHVITAFSVLVGSVLTTGLAIVLARDYAKYRRQKAIIETAADLLKTLTESKEGETEWSKEKTASSSQKKK